MCYVRTAKCRTHLFVIRPKLRSRNGIPLHSTDSASPGGTRNVRLCALLHKQFLLSHQKCGEQPTSDQSYSEQACQTDAHQVSTQEVADHWRRHVNPDWDRVSMTEDQSGQLCGILGTAFLYAVCNKRMLYSLASFDLMLRTSVFLIPSFCAAFLPPTLQQACRCWTWLSFQNSRSSSVQPH